MPKTTESNAIQIAAASETDLAAVREYAACVLQMTEKLVEGLTNEQYAAPSPSTGNSSIGQHMRHVLDHFRAPLQTEVNDVVDYDYRKRGVSVETDRLECLETLMSMIRTLRALAPQELAQRVGARFMASADGGEFTLPSSRVREVAFAAHHAIHHQALIAVIAREHGATLPEGFGKAPSTLSFERGEHAASS